MFAPRKSKKNPYDEYPDDIFKESRMSFGDHIEELRTRMILALKWLILFMVIGFVQAVTASPHGRPGNAPVSLRSAISSPKSARCEPPAASAASA